MDYRLKKAVVRMLITVVVESMYLGSASGFTQIVVDDSEPVQTLVNKFCQQKGASVDPLYAIINDANINFDGSKLISDYQVQDNDHLRLGRRREAASMFKFVNWYRIAVVGTALGLLGLLGVCLSYALLREIPYKYGVIFDAGSTHTDAIVYHWPGEKFHGTGYLSQVKNCSIDKKGIADVSTANVSSYLSKCIAEAKQSIPSNVLYEAEVFLGATGGMRILQERNSSMVESILTQVRNSLKESGFVYEDSHVDVISGDREGLSGWISVNYVDRTLPGLNLSSTEIVNSTFGSLDLGGASLQIAVEVDGGPSDPENSAEAGSDPFVHSVMLYEHSHKVYTQSFLCYGLVQALNRYRALLILTNNQTQNTNISSPCEPVGFSYNKTASQIFEVPCAPFPDSIPISQRETSYTFYGTNDVENCKANVSYVTSLEFCKLLNSSYCLNTTSFPKEVYTRKYLAYSAFGHIIQDFNLPTVGSKTDFLAKVDRICTANYADLIFLQHTFNIPMSLKILEGLCFVGNYMYSILTSAFKFTTDEDWQRIEFRTDVSGVGLSWPLGFMLNETTYMSQSRSIPEVDVLTFVILLSVFSLLLMFGFMFFYHAVRINKQTSYESSRNASGNSGSQLPLEVT